jgi:hypothetical protein
VKRLGFYLYIFIHVYIPSTPTVYIILYTVTQIITPLVLKALITVQAELYFVSSNHEHERHKIAETCVSGSIDDILLHGYGRISHEKEYGGYIRCVQK